MSDRHKELAARKAVEYSGDGMVVGLGTGSTAEFAIRALGERVKAEGLEIQCVPTSEASAALGEQVGLDIQTGPARGRRSARLRHRAMTAG
jgi:ribose 5-phosphate isomerase A